jgi:hypothetical protein
MSDRVRSERVSHEEGAVLAYEVNSTARPKVHGSIDLLEILEIDDRGDNPCECSFGVLKPARKHDAAAALGASDKRFAGEYSRRGAVALGNKI